jgi:hypothetical protein
MKPSPWAGRILTILPVLFLIFDGAIKLTQIAPVVDSFNQLGFGLALAPAIGILELLLVVVYVIPRTAVLGAILWTGYLGGAIASQLRVGAPLASHVLFPIYIAVMLWGGLYLREPRLRALTPVRS